MELYLIESALALYPQCLTYLGHSNVAGRLFLHVPPSGWVFTFLSCPKFDSYVLMDMSAYFNSTHDYGSDCDRDEPHEGWREERKQLTNGAIVGLLK